MTASEKNPARRLPPNVSSAGRRGARMTNSSPLTILDLPAAEAKRHPAAVTDVREGRLTAVVLRGVYAADVMARATEALEQAAHGRGPMAGVRRTTFPAKFNGWFYGQNLNLLADGLPEYFAEEPDFVRRLDAIVPPGQGIADRVLPLLAALDEGRPYRAAVGPEPGQRYHVTTIRGHGPGGYIPPHCDNEQALNLSYDHLLTLVRDDLFSMVLAFNRPDGGGVLEVYDYVVPVSARVPIAQGSTVLRPDLSECRSVLLPLTPGDLVIVDSGRHYHRVTPVEGDTTRWTACTFMSHALDRRAIYCWG